MSPGLSRICFVVRPAGLEPTTTGSDMLHRPSAIIRPDMKRCQTVRSPRSWWGDRIRALVTVLLPFLVFFSFAHATLAGTASSGQWHLAVLDYCR